jgi:hypothetical protein
VNRKIAIGSKEIDIISLTSYREKTGNAYHFLRYEVNKGVRPVLKAYKLLMFVFVGMNAQYELWYVYP